ncbi:hypothetical protein FD723_36475 (plasmid) [Nostoc sp. C052]|uniref:hypothetical protein n=1 Tax=Nostoc sp. C052 TaxID=2576902 RepID=UPI0015C323DD|nr:hypothetical protein [Nostoc sp. C052]QLE45749.1 hypothetical protein FD723_36475 [Nostoc sp. C052]
MREFTAGVASLRVLELGRSPYKVIKIYPKAVTKSNSADGARKSSAGNFDGIRRSGIRGDRYFILALSL